MKTLRPGALCAASLSLLAAATPLAAQADTDACTLLTSAQVGAAVGVPVSEGKHVTPTYVKTCTWNGSGSSKVKAVTLYLQTAAAYDGGKRMASQMAAASKGAAVKPASVGEDGYYFVAGDQVGLLVKKGGVSFKVTVYATLPVDKKEAMELTLAKEVLAKL
ncbi:MAG TPA: hypothetical protein VKP89_00560 [Burkholderiales bacterium]|nr:hypothetical protein [Burkholderiales bacterium]